ncbi:DNA-binding response regulator [Malaciobacter pacificus]|uniref:Two-component system response regulator n=1 Tax=Malaciobacter pacificus TaxID=1080223 RepID=A0A5C2H3V2_9BACT|nr:response regulator transcription factor [Malaciobacter pacificus]QEP33433.1 two-component system response regulator [Malaciobacter pacificus]GGD31434.1 DNA-binding response regulator [Malaciobacter pacificus]
MKILILEDNKSLSNVMNKALSAEGYQVDCFYDGDEASNAIENGYSCFILDINVPNLDGITVMEYIRYNHANTPVIIISANHDLEKIEKSYQVGCDDYLKKPFYIFELVQKVKKLISVEEQFIKFDEEYKFDFKNKKLYKNDDNVELTKKEILFLELFTKNLHHVASYDEIEEYVWEGEETNLTNIRTMIKRLRKKLPSDAINIIKGLGYSLNKNAKLI